MFRITDRRGYTYYMTAANMSNFYQSYDDKLAGAASFIKHEAEQGMWIKCYTDSMLRDAVAVRADEIYVIQEAEIRCKGYGRYSPYTGRIMEEDEKCD